MIKDRIAILDSGAGGLSILSEVLNNKLCSKCLYFADTKNMPYGTKNLTELFKITCTNIEKIISIFNPNIIIIGCNTIGSTIYKKIKRKFKGILILSVYPNIKNIHHELLKIKKNNVGCKKVKSAIIATPQTINAIKNSFIYRIIGKKIVLCRLPNLAPKIENNLQNISNIVPYLKRIFDKFKDFNYIYLGCTHYILISDIISTICKSAKIEDGVDILISCLQSHLKNSKSQNTSCEIKLFLTKDNESLKRKYKFLISKLIKNNIW